MTDREKELMLDLYKAREDVLKNKNDYAEYQVVTETKYIRKLASLRAMFEDVLSMWHLWGIENNERTPHFTYMIKSTRQVLEANEAYKGNFHREPIPTNSIVKSKRTWISTNTT